MLYVICLYSALSIPKPPIYTSKIKKRVDCLDYVLKTQVTMCKFIQIRNIVAPCIVLKSIFTC